MVLKWPRKLVSPSEERHVIILFSFHHSCQGDCVTVAAVKATERKQSGLEARGHGPSPGASYLPWLVICADLRRAISKHPIMFPHM